MKKISIILNIVLLAAVAILFVFHFTGKNKQPTLQDLIKVTTQISPDSASIAYVDYDSLLIAYDLYHEMNAQLASRKKELEAEFNLRQEQYKKQLEDFNEKVSKGLVTRYKAKEMEDDLLREQQTLLNLRDQLTEQLMEEEQVMVRNIHYNITKFLEEYNQSKGYQYILSYTFGGPILYSNKAFNITQDVINGINVEHQNSANKDK